MDLPSFLSTANARFACGRVPASKDSDRANFGQWQTLLKDLKRVGALEGMLDQLDNDEKLAEIRQRLVGRWHISSPLARLEESRVQRLRLHSRGRRWFDAEVISKSLN